MVERLTADQGKTAPDISDEDIYEAMKEIPGYLDITPGDFKEVYVLAYRQAQERLLHRATAKEIMTREVAWVRVDTPLQEVAELMAQRGVSGVPVLDGANRVVGVISEKDFLKRMSSQGITNFMAVVAGCLRDKGCKAVGIRGRQADDLMNSPAVTVREDTPVLEIARLFKEKAINRVPVLDAQGRLAGIVSRGDLLNLAPFRGGKA
ncbi:MAG: CBS domain-containing protein [Syntrophales bacterium]|nr:CBS domain-containing protein [Syntrophales bacterium]MDD5642999.1 CBS domain-containing protein [Syntrophales bacterium]